MWIEGVVMAADPDVEVTVNGERIAPRDYDFREWESLQRAPEWAVPSPPKVNRARPFHGPLRDVDGDVATLLDDKLEFDPDLQHQITQVSREVANGTIEAVTATTRFYDEMARLYKDQPTQYFIRRAGGQWSTPLELQLQPETSIIDVMTLDSAAQKLLLLTDREGFRSSDDAGASWREFNHGEVAFRNGQRVSVVVAGTPAAIYVLVDQDDVQQANTLYRHKRRTWFERLRIGLSEQLRGDH